MLFFSTRSLPCPHLRRCRKTIDRDIASDPSPSRDHFVEAHVSILHQYLDLA
jgi:hypothetical protein